MKVLGNLAYIVKSNNIGIGSDESHWKIVNSVKTGQRDNTGTIKCNNQVLVYGANLQQNSRCRQAKLSSVSKLWSDDDFQG